MRVKLEKRGVDRGGRLWKKACWDPIVTLADRQNLLMTNSNLLVIDILIGCGFVGAGEDVLADLGLDRRDREIDVDPGERWGRLELWIGY